MLIETVLEKLSKIEEKMEKELKKINNNITKTREEMKKINKKIDILYSSDILSKKIINNHEKRIQKTETKVSELK